MSIFTIFDGTDIRGSLARVEAKLAEIATDIANLGAAVAQIATDVTTILADPKAANNITPAQVTSLEAAITALGGLHAQIQSAIAPASPTPTPTSPPAGN